ncbi:MAG: anti-sigma factor [Phycisphaerales bacterium]
MITCKQLIEFLMTYLDDELPGEERAEFERHLSVCPSCVRYLHSYKQTVRLGKQAFEASDAPVPSEVPEGLIRAIMAMKPAGASRTKSK